MKRMTACALVPVALAALAIGVPRAPRAQADAPSSPDLGTVPLPRGDVFSPLIADLKEPQFLASYLLSRAAYLETGVGAVAYGENIGVVRWTGGTATEGMQIGLAGAVFAQFDMRTASTDLINADYAIGIPMTYRRGDFSARLRVYHQSSHLGDEFLLRVRPDRVNLSFEAVEVLVSVDVAALRVYGGGEILFHREPSDLESTMMHAGVEYRHPAPVLHLGTLGRAHWVAAADAKSWQRQDESLAWSARTGLEFTPVRDANRGGRRWSVLAEFYDGAAPYGQFYAEDISYVGLGLHFNL